MEAHFVFIPTSVIRVKFSEWTSSPLKKMQHVISDSNKRAKAPWFSLFLHSNNCPSTFP
jgi:hypothetical protein